MPFWIDVVSNGALVAATDFQGQHGCAPPHKIVQFDLKGSRPFILQLSNAAPESVRLTVTPPRRENYRLDRMYRLDGVRADRAIAAGLAEIGSAGASIQVFRNAVFSAPISF